MAVELFKDGKVIYVEPHSLKNNLAAGWTLHPYEEKEELSTEETIEELREKAKKAKIKSWHLLGEDKLRELLSDDNQN